ncbi:MAG TPA: formyltransferase family protein [bacterium]|nr:formyltransferase family protein [bacterium]
MNKYIICAYREWNIKLFNEKISKLPYEFYLITNKNELTINRLKEIRPEFIFFLDWSWLVSKEIITKFNCVGFHCSPLPEFRGGSPIQNQIIHGIEETKLTAFLMNEEIDAGDILLQEDLSLKGHLKDIFNRICELSYIMIQKIIEGKYIPKKQEGNVTYFKRRTPKESELKIEDFNNNLEYIYNFIRMLEDPYPNAFIKLADKKIIFKEAEYDSSIKKIRVIAEIVSAEDNKKE